MPTNQATAITTTELEDIDVMCVEGDPNRPIAEQAPLAFQQLERPMETLRNRKFYGTVTGDTYRACVALVPDEIGASLPNPTWTIPGGRYARRRIKNWNGDTAIIGPEFEQMTAGPVVDDRRPRIEFYRSQNDLILMVPVL